MFAEQDPAFAIGIGEICLGDAGGGGDAEKAVDDAITAVKAAEKFAGQVEKQVSSGTLEKLGDCMKAVEKLYPLIDTIVTGVKALESNPAAVIPSIDVISGSSQGDADAAAIVTLAVWDQWVLESDQQMKFAVGQNIDGASDYQLALRKHAINGRQLAQAQAEAINAGQEYVQAEMEVVLCEKDIENLQELEDNYEGESAVYGEAEAKFYDRFLACRSVW